MANQYQKSEFFSSPSPTLPLQRRGRESTHDSQSVSGILRCAKYAFSPNKLGYCGPNKNRDLFEYCQTQTADRGLNQILADFQVMYPYLSFIARENQLKDPFDQRVVDAYWLGNSLLDNISLNHFYWHLLDGQKLSNKLSNKLLNKVFGSFQKGATPHHNYHVFNIYKRTGYLDINHTLETMDKCRISWAKILAVTSRGYDVEYQPLVCQIKGRQPELKIGPAVRKAAVQGFVTDARVGDWISLHWDWPCEILTEQQMWSLKLYTKKMLEIAYAV